MNFHGGNVYGYSNILYDFSSNINPLGVPNSFKEALAKDMNSYTRYPDIEYTELKRNIRDYLIASDRLNILVGNGAVDLIYSLLAVIDVHKLYTIGPTFSEYKKAALNNRIEYDEIFSYSEDFSEIDIEHFLSRVEDYSAVILCNPNNPTGFLIDKIKLKEIAWRLKEKHCFFIIDEAFIEFTPDYPHSSFIDSLEQFADTFVIRAATKFFGMPGIRLGYVVTSNHEIYERVNESQQPWNVNTGAVIAGSCIFKDKEYISNSFAWIKSERDFFYEELSSFKNLHVYKSRANFCLLKISKSNLDAYKLRDKLIDHGILVRTPDGFSFLSNKYFRLAILNREANTALLKALHIIL